METRTDADFMRVALNLAARAMGNTSPNPAVGAVIVRNGRIVGQGYHRRAGLPHAEVEALRQAGTRARGSTMYVTLEPCDHVGRTPPCCDAVETAGVKRVVAAMKDPNPITNGRGMAHLRRAGIAVTTGVLEAEAKRLNVPFIKAMTAHLPWVTAKVAQSLDGKIATATGASRWISSPASRRFAHELRRGADSILVGVKTLIADDPSLTVRGVKRSSRPHRPLKVIVDSRLRTPLSSRCLSPGTIIATTVQSAAKHAPYRRKGIELIVLPPLRGYVPLKRLMRELWRRHQVQSVLIEGGGEVLASALQERIVDRLVWMIAPLLIGGRTSPSSVGGSGIRRLNEAIRLKGLTIRRLGPDMIVEADVAYPT
ncbi:MAG: bifunctional diaminohydroxyphosphoribosylaminopyrimidine deaminase/5-amino-6-(5-phosphoribosylamino)uracil reductase RibD, partial [Candidatus Omnitrophica bacterium]|nr:bifunctional diaminohydroxyphosphoribosylaminopyrimidine deaminase/5-amino-6-(5-phosphoribosylamino)uracil reductase RibD [Candidatus Omnitrophota bacterium]